MGVMTIDHMLFEKGTPATPTHSCILTYLTFRFQTQKRQSWVDTKIGMSNYLDWKMTHLKLHISILVTKLHHIMANLLNYVPDHINCFCSIFKYEGKLFLFGLNEEDLWGLDQTWFFFHFSFSRSLVFTVRANNKQNLEILKTRRVE